MGLGAGRGKCKDCGARERERGGGHLGDVGAKLKVILQ